MKPFFLIVISILLCAAPAAAQGGGRSSSIVTIDGTQYYVHTVQKDETVEGLSRLYNVPKEDILRNNPHIVKMLRTDQVVKIPVNRDGEKELNRRQMKRTFDTHTVKQGEWLYSIARQYGISVGTLLEDNEGLDPAALRPGQTLNIRKSEQGDTSGWQVTEQMEEYRDAINSITPDGQYYLVKSGETLYGLAKMFEVTVEQLEAVNDLSGGLKAGQLIKIPGESLAAEEIQAGGAGEFPVFDNPVDSLKAVREETRRRRGRGVEIKDISGQRRINISLLLPLRDDNGAANKDFVEFYQGVLLGLEDLKEQGISANLSLYNTARSITAMSDIAGSREFRETDLIIGPVYEDGLLPVVAFAERKGVPVVSPLQVLEGAQSEALYQMAPSQDTKYDKLKAMLSQPGLNIIYVTTAEPDADMDAHLKPWLPAGTKYMSYARESFGAALEKNLEMRSADNVVIVSANNRQVVDQILGSISSVQTNLTARSMMSSKVRVVGNSRWARFPTSSVDRELYFKLQVCYVTNYHVDRTDERVRQFDSRYIAAFGEAPSALNPFAYRGYDAAKLFAGAMMTRGDDFAWKVNGSNQTLLQISYRLGQTNGGSDYRNTEWALICYGMDYTITVN